MKYKDILFEVDGRIATLTFNLPQSRNPISGETTINEIEDACRRVQYDNEISVLIITGAGKAFSAGGNIKNMRERTKGFPGGPMRLQETYRWGIQRIPLAMDAVDVPIIAAVNGAAIGAGCDTAMMADIRIASTFAKFGETFLNLGLIPGDGGSWFLARLIGYARMAELTFTGKVIDAEEALRIGLVSSVVGPDELMPEAKKLAETSAEKPPRTLRLAKLLMKQASRMELKDFLDVCAQTQAVVQNSKDHQEALEAFFEKRPAKFTGE
jgi:enoyl-CoA hydratase/carnithine racemase